MSIHLGEGSDVTFNLLAVSTYLSSRYWIKNGSLVHWQVVELLVPTPQHQRGLNSQSVVACSCRMGCAQVHLVIMVSASATILFPQRLVDRVQSGQFACRCYSKLMCWVDNM